MCTLLFVHNLYITRAMQSINGASLKGCSTGQRKCKLILKMFGHFIIIYINKVNKQMLMVFMLDLCNEKSAIYSIYMELLNLHKSKQGNLNISFSMENEKIAAQVGFEPTTYCLRGRCSTN